MSLTTQLVFATDQPGVMATTLPFASRPTAVNCCVVPAASAAELIVCEPCGARADVDPRVTADVRAAVRAATGFTPHFDHFPLAGLCPRCADDRRED